MGAFYTLRMWLCEESECARSRHARHRYCDYCVKLGSLASY